VFEKRMLRGIFGTNREEVAGNYRKLHNEELHNLYIARALSSIIKVIKSRRMR
jgi:hypothetical protein